MASPSSQTSWTEDYATVPNPADVWARTTQNRVPQPEDFSPEAIAAKALAQLYAQFGLPTDSQAAIWQAETGMQPPITGSPAPAQVADRFTEAQQGLIDPRTLMGSDRQNMINAAFDAAQAKRDAAAAAFNPHVDIKVGSYDKRTGQGMLPYDVIAGMWGSDENMPKSASGKARTPKALAYEQEIAKRNANVENRGYARAMVRAGMTPAQALQNQQQSALLQMLLGGGGNQDLQNLMLGGPDFAANMNRNRVLGVEQQNLQDKKVQAFVAFRDAIKAGQPLDVATEAGRRIWPEFGSLGTVAPPKSSLQLLEDSKKYPSFELFAADNPSVNPTALANIWQISHGPGLLERIAGAMGGDERSANGIHNRGFEYGTPSMGP